MKTNVAGHCSPENLGGMGDRVGIDGGVFREKKALRLLSFPLEFLRYRTSVSSQISTSRAPEMTVEATDMWIVPES